MGRSHDFLILKTLRYKAVHPESPDHVLHFPCRPDQKDRCTDGEPDAPKLDGKSAEEFGTLLKELYAKMETDYE